MDLKATCSECGAKNITAKPDRRLARHPEQKQGYSRVKHFCHGPKAPITTEDLLLNIEARLANVGSIDGSRAREQIARRREEIARIETGIAEQQVLAAKLDAEASKVVAALEKARKKLEAEIFAKNKAVPKVAAVNR